MSSKALSKFQAQLAQTQLKVAEQQKIAEVKLQTKLQGDLVNAVTSLQTGLSQEQAQAEQAAQKAQSAQKPQPVQAITQPIPTEKLMSGQPQASGGRLTNMTAGGPQGQATQPAAAASAPIRTEDPRFKEHQVGVLERLQKEAANKGANIPPADKPDFLERNNIPLLGSLSRVNRLSNRHAQLTNAIQEQQLRDLPTQALVGELSASTEARRVELLSLEQDRLSRAAIQKTYDNKLDAIKKELEIAESIGTMNPEAKAALIHARFEGNTESMVQILAQFGGLDTAGEMFQFDQAVKVADHNKVLADTFNQQLTNEKLAAFLPYERLKAEQDLNTLRVTMDADLLEEARKSQTLNVHKGVRVPVEEYAKFSERLTDELQTGMAVDAGRERGFLSFRATESEGRREKMSPGVLQNKIHWANQHSMLYSDTYTFPIKVGESQIENEELDSGYRVRQVDRETFVDHAMRLAEASSQASGNISPTDFFAGIDKLPNTSPTKRALLELDKVMDRNQMNAFLVGQAGQEARKELVNLFTGTDDNGDPFVNGAAVQALFKDFTLRASMNQKIEETLKNRELRAKQDAAEQKRLSKQSFPPGVRQVEKPVQLQNNFNDVLREAFK